jgi:hypothetical protein
LEPESLSLSFESCFGSRVGLLLEFGKDRFVVRLSELVRSRSNGFWGTQFRAHAAVEITQPRVAFKETLAAIRSALAARL